MTEKTPSSKTPVAKPSTATNAPTPAATDSAIDKPLPKTTEIADLAANGDTDNDQPYLGTTLNSFGANASVNGMTGEVSIILPAVKMPTMQGLGPDLEINLAYNSTSSADKASPYLSIIAPIVQTAGGGYSTEIVGMDWDLDLPAIYWNNSAQMLRFKGQSFQFNNNSEDCSPAKTPFYYAKALENNNSLNYNPSDLSVTTPDGTVYQMQTINNLNLTVIASITKHNGHPLTFSYTQPEWLGSNTMQNGSITVTDDKGNQVLSIVSVYPPMDRQPVITPVVYVNFSNPDVPASSSQYDIAISFSTIQVGSNFLCNVSQYAYAEYPHQPYCFDYAIAANLCQKVSKMTYPTGAYTVFNWQQDGYTVNYGVQHITASGYSNIDHTFSYFFAPVDTQYYYDSDGNWQWYRLFMFSTAQANGEGSGGDDHSATYLCPNLNMYDTDEMADKVNPTNNWLDPLFNSTEHSWSGHSDQTGSNYQSGNVSQLIAQQTFTVYETTTYADGTNTASLKIYDALQRLQCEKNYCNGHWWDGQLFAQTDYAYQVPVTELGMSVNDKKPYALLYPSYQSLPAYFDKPSQVKVTSYPMFNGVVQSGSASVSTITHTYDSHGNVQSSSSASGITKQFSYYPQTGLPCNLNPYITSVTTQPTGNTRVGALGTLGKAQYLDPNRGEVAITQSQTCTDYTSVNNLLVPSSQTGSVNGIAAPITRSYAYNTQGQVTAITESGTGFSSIKTMTYSVDGNGNQTTSTTTTYAEGGVGPSLPTVEVVDFLGRTVSTTDSLGRVTNTQYDSLGRMTLKTELANLPTDQQLVTRYQYGVYTGGSSLTVTTPTGAQLIYSYDSLGRQTSIKIQPVSGSLRTIRSFDYAKNTADGGPCGGQAIKATTHIAKDSSIKTHYYYNTVGAKIATVPPTGLAQATLGFSVGDAVYALSFNFTLASSSPYSIKAYGWASLAEMDALTGGTVAIYNFNSSLLQLSGLSGPNLNAVLSHPSIKASLLAADGSVNTAVMTAANQASFTTYGYDSLFRLVSESLTGNGNTLTTQRWYDVNGRLTQTLDPKGNQFNLQHTVEGFPSQLSLTTESGKGAQYTLATAQYNAAGQKTRYAYTPVAAGGNNPNVKTYTFNATSGLATSETDAAGNTINYLYYPTGWLAAAYSKTANGYYLWSSLAYDRYGAIITQQNGPIASEPTLTNLSPSTYDAIYTFTYNGDGQLESKTVQYAGQTAKTTRYSYDSFGNMNGFSNAFGQNITVSLDKYGRKSQLRNGSKPYFTHQVNYAYDSLGRPSTLTKTYFFPHQGVSSAVETLTYEYDDLLQTTGLSSQFSATVNGQANSASPLLGFTQNLSYDLWGNIIANSQSFIDSAGKLANQSNQAYTYDEFDRLTGFDANQQGSTSYPGAFNGDGEISSQAFSYDGWDNLLTLSTTLVKNPVLNTTTYQYNSQYPCQLEAFSGVGVYAYYDYDALGRVTRDAWGNAISYDALGYVSSVRLKNGMVIDYTYGPNRELIKQSMNDGSALYNYYEGGKLVGRQDQTKTSTFKTLIGLGADSTWTTTDLLGNPVLIKDSCHNNSGQISEVVDAKNLFSPTGIQTNLAYALAYSGYPQNLQPPDDTEPLLVANSTGGGVGYNTEITDPTTGYQLLGSYRAYDPVLGRFLQPDSASPGAGGINPYAYTSGKFVGCSDPTGHYTYTYQSYNDAKEAIKRAAERKGNFWSRVGKSYLSVAINIIKHPTNPSGYVAAAMLAYNPSAPLVAAVMGEIGQASPVGAFMSGAYAGYESAIVSTETLGAVQFNPQNGLGTLNTEGVGNMLGLLSLGYLNLSQSGTVQVHSGHSLVTHMLNEVKGDGDLLENVVSGVAGIAIGLCYDMPMDFAHGEYYEAGFAFGMNSALLVAMVVEPEDAGGEVAAEGTAAGAGASGSADAGAAADEGGAAAHGNEPKGASEVKSPHQSVHEPAGNAGHAPEAKPSPHARTSKLGHFTKEVGKHLGKEMLKGLGNAETYNNLNMSDPRSPFSTAAWQNMLYRKGDGTTDKK